MIALPALGQAADHKIFLLGKLAKKHQGDIDYLAVFTARDVIRKYADDDADSIIFIKTTKEALNIPEPAMEVGVVALRKSLIDSGLLSREEADAHFEEVLPSFLEQEKIMTSKGFYNQGNLIRISGTDHVLNCYPFNFCENNKCFTAHSCY